MAVRLNKNYLIASFLLALLTQSPALALDPQATGSLNPPPSSLITLGVGKPRTTDLRPWLWGAALRGNLQQSFPHTRPGSSEVRGKITGRVRVAGRIEKLEPLRVFKNKEFCGTRVPNETFLVGRSGSLSLNYIEPEVSHDLAGDATENGINSGDAVFLHSHFT